MAEGRNRDVDQSGINRREVGVTQAAQRKETGVFRLDQEIGACDQLLKLSFSFFAVKVERDASLVAVQCPKPQ